MKKITGHVFYIMKCVCCEKNKPEFTFKIEQKLTKSFTFKKELKINKNICAECFKPESIKGMVRANTLNISLTPYLKKFQNAFWNKSDANRSDFYTMHEAFQILKKEKILKTEAAKIKDQNKRVKEWIDARNPKMRKEMEFPAESGPYTLNVSVIEKEDFQILLNIEKRLIKNGQKMTKHLVNKKHKLSQDRLDELFDLGYVRYAKDGSAKFASNNKEKKKACIKCGEIKDFNSFRYTSLRKCMKCKSIEEKEYYLENREEILAKVKTPEMKPKIKERQRMWRKKQWAENPLYRLKKNIRQSICKSLTNKGFKKNSTTQKILGCSYEDFMEHLQSQFTKGMTMENHGEWQIDHRLPLAAGQTKEKIIMLNHYTNLQPLWAADNLEKLDKHCPDELKAFFEKRRRESGR